jgi:hypothetical protein
MPERSRLLEPSPGVAPPQETLTDTELHKGRPLSLTVKLASAVMSLNEARKICRVLTVEKVAPQALADVIKDKE